MLVFFKQKTAYEIGLGIPAEPLFRSLPTGSVDPNFGHVFCKLFNWRRLRTRRPKLGSTLPVGSVRIKCTARSEERRVGKECRSRWLSSHHRNKLLME